MSGGTADVGIDLTIPESKFKKFLNWLNKPFKKWKEDLKKYDDEQNERINRHNLEWEFMRKHLPTGKTFDYIGVKMTVYGHFEGRRGSLKAGIPSTPRYIACHYKNENGEICRQEFNFQNWDGLRLKIEKEILYENKI